ncbi:hypothetical protein HY837_01045 [archaeon]|nr:hypothetical protein [archaeon]
MSKLWHVLKKINNQTKEDKYGIFCAETNETGNIIILSRGAAQPNLEELAKHFTDTYWRYPTFVFDKQEDFPFVQVDEKIIYTYKELTQEERERFLTYLQRTLNGEPARKRHNPE